MARNDDLHIAPLRGDGVTYGTLTWIWSVVVDGQVYVRASTGTDSRWYQAALKQKAGRVTTADMPRAVTFGPVTSEVQPRIDSAYRAKYADRPYLAPMIGERARAATLRVLPSEVDA
ncbi:DUF2255 family protein [Deinococcus sonorensis]|uniref:DUF2255 family protein n=2 Tax=Deinococcus sonorensis TaxID=309891 RepID=A0AAU7UGT9_9DEIO